MTHSPSALPTPTISEPVAVDMASLTADQHVPFCRFDNLLRAESDPDEPVRSLSDHIISRQSVPSFVELRSVYVRDTSAEGEKVIGFGELQMPHDDANPHMASIHIRVLPEYRRLGIARNLLAPLARIAMDACRSLLTFSTSDIVPAGEAFAIAIGATPGLLSRTSQLNLDELTETFIHEYRDRCLKRGAGEFTIRRCDSPVPEEMLPLLMDVGNQVARDIPRGDMGVDAEQMTSEQIRAMEESLGRSGSKMLTVVAQSADGRLVGMSTIIWKSTRAHGVEQGLTGVRAEFRGRGIAGLLKLTNIEWVRSQYPQVRVIRTGNADSNGAMLAINHALGFRLYRTEMFWQLATDAALAYATGSGTSATASH